ncbi:hypothetical protein [Oceanisphaera psychrotolerans]|uniref:hypothetical protein n=1 Tax=Oceanisphaera psychrotolerans TaxID=1414654 RepID=UPI001C31A711|nr:hypothetical protein [Oceanisphaera psychrotolerans]
MIKRIVLFILLMGSIVVPTLAAENPAETVLTGLEEVPTRDVELGFGQLIPSSGSLALRGTSLMVRSNSGCAVMKWCLAPRLIWRSFPHRH